MAKINYYDMSNLLNAGCNWNILLGSRANGKSYQVKKYIIENAFERFQKFVYLRRYRADIKSKAVEEYFTDMPIKEITKGEYDTIVAWSGVIYFGKYDTEKDVVIKGREVGWYCALNEAERYKSRVFKNCTSIIYEEFITDMIYLTDEPRLLQQFVSTVARHDELKVFLIGNTISRVCPYFQEYGLDHVNTMKPNTIEVYHFHVDDETTIDIAVEYCASANYKNKMFFGQTSKQIISGEWETRNYPRLPRSQKDYELIYEMLVEYQKFIFVLQLLVEPIKGSMVVFIYPKSEKSQKKIERKLTQNFSDSIFESATFLDNPAERHIIECFKKGKVCYSDNLTATDFRNVNNQIHIV